MFIRRGARIIPREIGFTEELKRRAELLAAPLSADIVEYADGTPATVDQMAKDVSAFLMWTAEPKLADRKGAGARNFLFVALLAVLLYLTNKKLWAGVKKRKKAA